jgi:hypothetical protein
MSTSDDKASCPGDKKSLTPEEINYRNRLYWEARSEKFRKQLKKWPRFAEIARNKMEADTLINGLRSTHSMEDEVEQLVEQLRIVVKLTAREEKIWRVIQRGVEGAAYCRELHRARVKPRKFWLSEDCPSTYPEAYREGVPWRKRIQDEKSRIKSKAELAQLVDKQKL